MGVHKVTFYLRGRGCLPGLPRSTSCVRGQCKLSGCKEFKHWSWPVEANRMWGTDGPGMDDPGLLVVSGSEQSQQETLS